MPLRNRVTPFGDIIETPARGTLFGNRGRLHDDDRRLVRTWQVRRWIACRLEFNGWHREPMPPGRHTGLFFLDEATALAAGHRPCAECRHQDFVRFRDAWRSAHLGRHWMADDIDRVLHAERLGHGGSKRLHSARLADLPDGAMIAKDGKAWLVLGPEVLQWTPFGYSKRLPLENGRIVALLTPPSTVAAIRHGYRPGLPNGIGPFENLARLS